MHSHGILGYIFTVYWIYCFYTLTLEFERSFVYFVGDFPTKYQMVRYTLTGDLTEDNIPKGTISLRVYNYSRTSLIVPPSVIRLDCDNNQLTELIIPPSVTKLHCSRNQLTELILPPSVTELYCVHNRLMELIVPQSVTKLYCSYNQLTELIVPPLVISLGCSHNQLTELIVPPSVTDMYCGGNQLTELIVPPSVTDLYCHNNTFSEEILLLRGKLSPTRKRIAVRKAVRRMRKQFYRRKENVMNEVTSRPSGTVGAWDIGGNIFQENMEAFE